MYMHQIYLVIFLSILYADRCLVQLIVTASTSDIDDADSSEDHAIEIKVDDQQTRSRRLKGDEDKERKGSFVWEFNLKDFNFADRCLKKDEIENVAIIQTGIDGWNIRSIQTHVIDSSGKVCLFTQNLSASRWIDADGGEDRRRFDLTFVNQ